MLEGSRMVEEHLRKPWWRRCRQELGVVGQRKVLSDLKFCFLGLRRDTQGCVGDRKGAALGIKLDRSFRGPLEAQCSRATAHALASLSRSANLRDLILLQHVFRNETKKPAGARALATIRALEAWVNVRLEENRGEL